MSQSLALLTDFYQLTMACAYWKKNMHTQEAVFCLNYRQPPFGGNHTVTCGLNNVAHLLQNWCFTPDDIAYLRALTDTTCAPLFPEDFLAYLSALRFTGTVDAMPEGTVSFAYEPLLRIQGRLPELQLLESLFLNIINFQTLIATKAARVCQAALGEEILEFGLRRAQGPDGGLSASRAAYVGGCTATSNTLAGKYYGIPVRGTHSHSWVQAFSHELEAFLAYAEAMPSHCVLLVDTFDTLKGVKNAIIVGKKLRERGRDLQGIRLDSGDLADLSIKARDLLDQAGFQKTKIIASNYLDEYVIADLKKQNAKIAIWGVGTHLSTAYDQPALDGVYKLSSIRENNQWQFRMKLSKNKISIPGRLQVRRFFQKNKPLIDIIYDIDLGISDNPEFILLNDASFDTIHKQDHHEDLLVPIFRDGLRFSEEEPLTESRDRAINQVALFQKTHGKNNYPVALEKKLYDAREILMEKIKK